MATPLISENSEASEYLEASENSLNGLARLTPLGTSGTGARPAGDVTLSPVSSACWLLQSVATKRTKGRKNAQC